MQVNKDLLFNEFYKLFTNKYGTNHCLAKKLLPRFDLFHDTYVSYGRFHSFCFDYKDSFSYLPVEIVFLPKSEILEFISVVNGMLYPKNNLYSDYYDIYGVERTKRKIEEFTSKAIQAFLSDGKVMNNDFHSVIFVDETINLGEPYV